MLTLSVYVPDANGDEPYVYTNVHLIEQTPSFVSEYQQGRITQPNAQIRKPDTFLGVSDWFTLPEGNFRAQVTYNGEVLLNGKCRRMEVEWDAVTADFVVKITDDSTEAAQDALRAVRLTNLPEDVYDDLPYRAIVGLVPYNYRDNVTRSSTGLSYLKKIGFVRAYNLLDVVQACFTAAELEGAPVAMYDQVTHFYDGAPYTLRRPVHPDLFVFSLQGFSGAINDSDTGNTFLMSPSQYGPNSLTLPNWDGYKTVVEAFCRMCGLTFAAHYEAFPGPGLIVELLPDTEPTDTTGLPEIDGLWNQALFTLTRADAWKPRLSVSFEVVDKVPELVSWGDGFPHVTTEGPELDQFYSPPPYAVQAADRWLFDADGKPLDGSELQVPFTLAPMGTYGDEGWYTETTEAVPDGAGHDLIENRAYGYPVFDGTDDERCYLASLRYVLAGTRTGLLWRRIVNAAEGQIPVVNETWAPEVFRNYRLSRVERDSVQGIILASPDTVPFGALTAGRLEGGVSFDERPWLVERVERRTEDEGLSLRLSGAVYTPEPETDQPYYTGAVIGLDGKFEDVENDIDPEKEYCRITWDWPGAQSGRALIFDVEKLDFTSGWEMLVYSTYGRHVWDFNVSYGYDVNGERYAMYRVRAVFPERSPLDPTEGPWQEILIYF